MERIQEWIQFDVLREGESGQQHQRQCPLLHKSFLCRWALMRIDPNRLVRLMGHGTKKIIYEVYGDYIEGLERFLADPRILRAGLRTAEDESLGNDDGISERASLFFTLTSSRRC